MASSVHVECSRQVLAKFAMSTCHLRAHVLHWMLFSQSPLCARFILVASETYTLWQFPHRSPVNLPGYLLACLSIDSVPLFDTANNTHSVLYDRSLTRKPSALAWHCILPATQRIVDISSAYLPIKGSSAIFVGAVVKLIVSRSCTSFHSWLEAGGLSSINNFPQLMTVDSSCGCCLSD